LQKSNKLATSASLSLALPAT